MKTTPTALSFLSIGDSSPRTLVVRCSRAMQEKSPRIFLFTRDGSSIVFSLGGSPKDIWYATDDIASVPVAGGIPRRLTEGLDRNTSGLKLSPDGGHVLFLLEDAGNTHLARLPVSRGRLERMVSGDRDVNQFDVGPKGELAVLETTFSQPAEISWSARAAHSRGSRR